MLRAGCLRVCDTNCTIMFCLHLLKVDSEDKEGRLQEVYFTIPLKFPVLGQAEFPTPQQTREMSRQQRVLPAPCPWAQLESRLSATGVTVVYFNL